METVILNQNPRNKYSYFKRKPRRVYLNQVENERVLTLRRNRFKIGINCKTNILIKKLTTVDNDMSPSCKYFDLTRREVEKKFSNINSIKYLKSEKFKTKRMVEKPCGDILDNDISYKLVLEDTIKNKHFYELTYWKEIQGNEMIKKMQDNEIDRGIVQIGIDIFSNVNYEINFTFIRDGKRYVDYKNGFIYSNFLPLIELPNKDDLENVLESLEIEIKFTF